jgi:hypothetical protein
MTAQKLHIIILRDQKTTSIPVLSTSWYNIEIYIRASILINVASTDTQQYT